MLSSGGGNLTLTSLRHTKKWERKPQSYAKRIEGKEMTILEEIIISPLNVLEKLVDSTDPC